MSRILTKGQRRSNASPIWNIFLGVDVPLKVMYYSMQFDSIAITGDSNGLTGIFVSSGPYVMDLNIADQRPLAHSLL